MKRNTCGQALAASCVAILLSACGATTGMPSGTVVPHGMEPGPVVPDARFDSVRAVIQRLVNEEGVPSIAVGVAKDGVILWQEGFGWADRERSVPATPHTPYSLASVTKPITGTAIMVLNERGHIGLDAPIENYLGGIRLRGFAGDTREVTPRRIMAHSAGLANHALDYDQSSEIPPREQGLLRYGSVVFPPGAFWEYSNIGYGMLDMAISNASGHSYAEFLRREIFLPLGMQRSAVMSIDSPWGAEAATRYDDQRNPLPHYVSDTPGSADVWSSVHDMLRFAMFHLGTPLPGQQPILTPASIAAMQQVASAPGVRRLAQADWGLSWALSEDRGHRVVQHGGGMAGVATRLFLYPDERVAVVVLSNQADGRVHDVARQVAAAVVSQERDDPGAPPAVEATTRPLSDFEGKWVGTVTTHEGEEPFALTIRPDGDAHAQLGTLLTTSLVRGFGRIGDAMAGSFHGVVNTSDARPHTHDVALTLLPQGDQLIGRITAIKPDFFQLSSFARLRRLDQALLDEYVGVYSHDQGADRVIVREGERLYSQRGTGTRYELDAIGEDVFLMVGTGGSLLRFERENGRVAEVVWQNTVRGRRG